MADHMIVSMSASMIDNVAQKCQDVGETPYNVGSAGYTGDIIHNRSSLVTEEQSENFDRLTWAGGTKSPGIGYQSGYVRAVPDQPQQIFYQMSGILGLVIKL